MNSAFDSFEIAMLIKEIYAKSIKVISDGLKDSGLTHQQIMVIKIIAHNGEVIISDICEEMSLAKGTVSGIVRRLEEAGYVEKVKHEGDKRNTYVRFSAKGREFAKEFRFTINKSFDEIFKNFTDEELLRVKNELKVLKEKIK
ncbi:MarR family winged helix-turn-helix transcriptional regulator [Clostridium septicum]|uniref:MarR family transcriptional regulator n=1 Tax=Clostridium septicum TaxID=1504 RepID=A0A9N7JNF3_CLOSE|nr:MarR family transcriptional regulator [Clostridium septicum]AYE35120.1 MarR family transcriptional regulator [Clostridium septicum]MDU1314218.1 MarR family transcriptional regulator [Clostridium septicum]QAS60511.1 MarR family transcriptional regulator [Clostridium septicum]UEC20229.1 MarR family transcriptional regulator [Clostridium septicum]USS01717.1 MarR family transcriptional regulator [Clostridium septicum]